MIEMGILSTLFKRHTPSPSNPLVRRLLSNSEATFLPALRAAAGLAKAADAAGLAAMREALALRSGKTDLSYYQPGVVVTTDLEGYLDAKARILELAQSKQLLADVYQSGALVSAFFVANDDRAMMQLLRQVEDLGGLEQKFALQLLFTEMMYSARARRGA